VGYGLLLTLASIGLGVAFLLLADVALGWKVAVMLSLLVALLLPSSVPAAAPFCLAAQALVSVGILLYFKAAGP
jgi:hypothetical protein